MGEAQIVDGVLELATGRRLVGDGQAFPITESVAAFRLSSMVKAAVLAFLDC